MHKAKGAWLRVKPRPWRAGCYIGSMLWFLLKLFLACVLGFWVLIGALQMSAATLTAIAVFGFVGGLLINADKRRNGDPSNKP